MDDDESERLEIREKISNMSFEELAKLKQELGEQVYNETIFGVKKKPHIEKRLNKNRPTEMSSKLNPQAIAKKLALSGVPSKSALRDPRFDYLCGEYNPRRFSEDYNFLRDIKRREKEELRKELKKTTNSAKQENIKFLIRRMENQERAEQKMDEERKKKNKEYEERIEMLRQGKKPHYVKKSEKRVLDLVEQYEALKKAGKVRKDIERQRQNKKKKDRKKFPSTEL